MTNHSSDQTLGAGSRANVLGVGVSAIDLDEAVKLSDTLLRENRRGYICVTGVHGVIVAQTDPDYRSILNQSFITTPDGMPMVWVGRLQGKENIDRVYGPDFMLAMCRLSVERGYRHFLYGGGEGVVEQLAAALKAQVPGLQIAGTYTPPFRALTPAEEADLSALVDTVKPDIFWVGLSTPKQERFMAQYLRRLDTKLMVGVGAAFDFHVGSIKDAPGWMKSLGLQWLHRLIQEPRRLSRRYFEIIPTFIWNISLQLLHFRKYEI